MVLSSLRTALSAVCVSIISSVAAHAATLDGFDGGLDPQWVGSGAVSAAAAYSGSDGLLGNGNWIYRTDAAANLQAGDVLSAYVRFTFLSSRAYIGFGAEAAGASSFVLSANTGDIRFQNNDGYRYQELNTKAFSFTENLWYFVTVQETDGDIIGSVYSEDGSTLLTSLVASGLSRGFTGGVALRGFNNNIDEIAINAGATPAVPLPAGLPLAATGLASLIGIRKLRKQAA